jgi:hypothetical protein
MDNSASADEDYSNHAVVACPISVIFVLAVLAGKAHDLFLVGMVVLEGFATHCTRTDLVGPFEILWDCAPLDQIETPRQLTMGY